MLCYSPCSGPTTLSGQFVGETLLHVLAVNSRFDELWEALEDLHERLTKSHDDVLALRKALRSCCSGVFFKDTPQRDFGGHLFAWIAYFGQTELLRRAMDELGVGEEWHEQPDPITGFYPIHTVVRAEQV